MVIKEIDMANLCRKVIMKPTNLNTITKRTFWKTSEIEINVHIKSIGRTGVIFSHNNIACSINKLTLGNNSTEIIPSDNVGMSFHMSLDKYPQHIDKLQYLKDKMRKDEPIRICMETHMMGRPTIGFTLSPHYLKNIYYDY